jgi:alpha-D-ribose 1-methylphosphonate 5-triphosphate synthase subunit PhnL
MGEETTVDLAMVGKLRLATLWKCPLSYHRLKTVAVLMENGVLNSLLVVAATLWQLPPGLMSLSRHHRVKSARLFCPELLIYLNFRE